MADAKSLKEWHAALVFARDFAVDNGFKFKLEVDVPGEREKVTLTKYFNKEKGRENGA